MADDGGESRILRAEEMLAIHAEMLRRLRVPAIEQGDELREALGLRDAATFQYTPVPFTAEVGTFPAAGATLSGVVRFIVRGSAMKNAELLGPVGYNPKHGLFEIRDEGRLAVLDFDTNSVGNGAFSASVAVFDQPQFSTLPTKEKRLGPWTWTVRNPERVTVVVRESI